MKAALLPAASSLPVNRSRQPRPLLLYYYPHYFFFFLIFLDGRFALCVSKRIRRGRQDPGLIGELRL